MMEVDVENEKSPLRKKEKLAAREKLREGFEGRG